MTLRSPTRVSERISAAWRRLVCGWSPAARPSSGAGSRACRAVGDREPLAVGARRSACLPSHQPSMGTKAPDCRAAAIGPSADDLQLGHLGGLDVLDADLGGELLDHA